MVHIGEGIYYNPLLGKQLALINHDTLETCLHHPCRGSVSQNTMYYSFQHSHDSLVLDMILYKVDIPWLEDKLELVLEKDVENL